MSNITQSILDSIEILLNKRVSQLQFDRTVRATITAVVDASLGKYRVRYQDSEFYAFTPSLDVSYEVDDQVYVEIPSNDYETRKLIIGSVKELGSKYIDAVTTEGKMTIIGSNVFSSNQTISFCSYNGNQSQNLKNVISIDRTALSIYKKSRKYILLGMSVKTALPAEQIGAGGNYGIILQARYYNSTYKSQEVQSESDLITRTYVLDCNNMQGNPYKYLLKNRQYTIFSIDGDNLYDIYSIQAFCKDFPVTKSGQPTDIFLSDFELEFMEPLTEEELNGTSLKILTPNGAYISSANDDTRYLKAELKIKGRVVDPTVQTVNYYWFVKDTTVSSSSNKYYSSYAGEGWRCLNDVGSSYNGVTQFVADRQGRYNLQPTAAPSKITTFKCVAVYDGTQISGTVEIYNQSSSVDLSITSSAGTQFYFDTGKTTLTCSVTPSQSNLAYHWGYRTEGGVLIAVSSTSRAIDITIGEATEYIIYECTVTKNGAYLGTTSITLTNGVPENEYTLVINNGTQIFKYDEYGVSPASSAVAAEDRITIPTLTFDIYNDQQQLVTPSSVAEIEKSCEIKWVWPDEDYTMLTHDFTLTDDLIVNPTTNGNLLRHVLANSASLTFGIVNKYDIDATDNNITLEVNFQGHALVASTNFTFLKEGELGTNGTEYSSRLVPFNEKYKQVYLENGHIEAWYDSVSKSYNAASGAYTNVDTFTFNQVSTNRALRAQLWNGAAAALYDSQGSSSITADLSWELVDIGKNTTHNAEIASNGAITWKAYNNVSTVVKSTIQTSELSELAKNYYATYPLTVAHTPNNSIHAIVTGGFNQCMYNSDGTRGSFNSKPFTLRIFKDGNIEQVLDNSRISWYTSWYDNKKNSALTGQNEVTIEPPSLYNSETTNNYIVVTYYDNSGSYKIIISVHLYLNRYGLAAMNDWDGTSIKINQEGSQYILAPQIGAGEKDSDNTFTGITMGKSFGVNGNNQSAEIGLMGFHKGARSLFLDAKTGRSIFGKAGSSQITIAPEKYGAAPAGSIYSWNYFNFDSSGKPSSTRGAGMIIDLDDPSIKFGSGNFSVDKNGHLIAKGGGSIGGWNITDTTLYSNKTTAAGRITLDSSNSSIYSYSHNTKDSTGQGFYLGTDGISFHKYFRVDEGDLKVGNLTGSRYWTIDGSGTQSYIGYNTTSLTKNNTNQVYLGTDGIRIGNKFRADNEGKVYVGNLTGSRYWTIDGSGSQSYIGYNTDSFNSENLDDVDNYSIGGSGSQVYVGTNGIRLGSRFAVDNYGNLVAKHLIAKNGGNIGGWTIGTNKLSAGNIELNGNGSISGGSSYTWSISQNGTATFKNLVADNSGTIGGWKIGSTYLRATDNTLTLDSSGKISGGTNHAWSIDSQGNAKFNNITCNNVWSFGSGNNKWTNSRFTFNLGTLGGNSVGSSGLAFNTGNMSFGAGRNAYSSGTTGIYCDNDDVIICGDIYANSGYFKGTVEATKFRFSSGNRTMSMGYGTGHPYASGLNLGSGGIRVNTNENGTGGYSGDSPDVEVVSDITDISWTRTTISISYDKRTLHFASGILYDPGSSQNHTRNDSFSLTDD